MSKLQAKIRNKVVNALSCYQMLEQGDNVMVAVSGGIDSSVLISLLVDIKRRAPFEFTLQPVLVDHKFPGTNPGRFSQWLGQMGLSLVILECPTYALATGNLEKGKSPCQICSRQRRGALYSYAKQHQFTKIALGHNRDDLNETILLNMFYSGKLAGMPPKLKSNKGCHTVIRPLCNLPKTLIKRYAKELNAPLIDSVFCHSIPGNARYRIRHLLAQLEQKNPGIGDNLLASQGNLIPSQLMDKRYWDFNS